MFPMMTAEVGSVVDIETFREVLVSLTNQVSVANVVGVLAGIVGITVGFAFMWWGVRYGTAKIMAAFKKGRA